MQGLQTHEIGGESNSFIILPTASSSYLQKFHSNQEVSNTL
jgi:hypothetical protein